MKRETFDRRMIRMSLEGWYYTFVLGFIGGAAILRRANLLLILAAMLTAPLLFNWRFVMASMRNLVLRRKIPECAVAGKSFLIDLTLANSSLMDSWHVQVDETLVEESSGVPTSVSVVVDRVPLENRTTRSYECLLLKRGRYNLQSTVVSTSYPIGLIRASGKIENDEVIFVAPPVGKLAKTWLQWAQPDEVDEPRSIGQKGILDGMFYAVREYRQGDSRRAIHWRSTAKLGKPAVKQYEKQADREMNIVVDLYSDNSTIQNEKAEVVLSFVATLFEQISFFGRCEVNVLIVGNRHRIHSGHANQSLIDQLGRTLAEIKGDNSIDFSLSLDRFVESKSHRSPVIVISTRACIHDNRESIDNDLPFPYYVLHSESNADLPCCWIDVGEPEFDQIFERPVLLTGEPS